jgi:hypothetical protein
MTRNELTLCLMRGGIYSGAWALDDDNYEPVSREFVLSACMEFPSFLPPELRTMRDIGGGKTVPAPRWITEVWDCDNLARAFGVYLGICMARDAVLTKRTRGNIASGLIKFCPTPDTSHAANWFVDHDGSAHIVDCATLNFVTFTDAQRASIFSGESI